VTAVSRSEGVQEFEAGAVILAMGCRERPRGALGIPGWRCSGICTAGTAQKLVNRKGMMPGKRVVILGSGDIGLIMARRMTFLGAKVLGVVELMPYSSGLKRNIVQCLNDYDIPLLLSHTVVDVAGKERLTGVTVAQVDEALRPIPGTEQIFDCDTLLLSVGLIPENELSSMAGVELSAATSGALVDEQLETSVPGIFSCGNVLHVHDLVDFVSEEAAKAGLAALHYAEGKLPRPENQMVVESGFGAGGVVPQRMSKTLAEPVQLMFRPRGVYQNAAVAIELDGAEVARRKFRILTPGEMVRMAFLPAWAAEHPEAQKVTVRVVLPQEGGEQV
ncbi:FAD-dependent oxidoreductase, partial [Pygmaiobacter massiliensis]|uniref:NAD(P)/FAD-dependent oxidoreductase n=1 Tax=Pygmaiobacter massiliensis TaxID=1917873 RepID=UPI002A828DB1